MRPQVALNPPEEPGSFDDQGTTNCNYLSEPLFRRSLQPLKQFDIDNPTTKTFKTVKGDFVRIRLVDGSHEEQHSFVVHGMKWRRHFPDRNSRVVNQQTTGAPGTRVPQGSMGLGRMPHLKPKHYPLFRCASSCRRPLVAQTLVGCGG